MIMRKLVLVAVVCLMDCMALSAQKSAETDMSILMSTVWKMEINLNAEMPYDDGYFCKFDRKNGTFFRMKKGRIVAHDHMASGPFYLSDRIEETFDDAKAGKVMNGRYLIRKAYNVKMTEEDGAALRKSLFDYVVGIEPDAKEKRQQKKMREKMLGNAEAVPYVYEIVSLTENEIVLERVMPEIVIGAKTLRYTAYNSKKKSDD